MKKALLGLVFFVLSLLLALTNPLQGIQHKVSDLFFTSRPAGSEITIIAIDEKSLDPQIGLGRFKDWPRSYYAQLLRTINEHSPAVVAFDLDFRDPAQGISELRLKQLIGEYDKRSDAGEAPIVNWYTLLKKFIPERSSNGLSDHPDDVDFQKAISASGSVVLTSSLVFEKTIDENDGVFPPASGVTPPIFGGTHVTIGYKEQFLDRDGVLRRMTAAVDGQKSFILSAALEYLRAKNLPIDRLENYPVNRAERIAYSSVPGSFKTLSFSDVMAGTYDPADIAGKLVIIGPTSRIINDFQTTPTSRDAMAGVEINANAMDQLIQGRTLSEQGLISLILLLALLCIGGTYIVLTLRLSVVGIVIGALALALPLIGFALYQGGFILNVVYSEAALIITALGALWYRNKTELAEKRQIKNAFAHYVSPVLVDEIAKNPAALKLGGKREQITVLFTDIVGFTTLSEQLTPEDTVALLNDYLTTMTEIIFEYHGTLDKYQGDAIMALFGAPLEDPQHAVNAVNAGLSMRRALTALHEKWNAIPNLPFKNELIQLDFRVGIGTGPAVVGNVGSQKRFDYTAIGDIVNLGSRLESLNRKYGTRIIVDKGTFTTITQGNNPFIFRKLDVVRVKGKKIQTEIFEVLGTNEMVTPQMKSMLDEFESGRINYLERNFIGAREHFEACSARFPDDGPSQIYKNRCDFFLRKQPPRDWDGVVNLDEK